MAQHRTRTLIPNQSPVLVLRDREGKELARFPGIPNRAASRDTEPGITARALKRGLFNTASDFATTGGLIAEWLGSDEFAQGFFQKADEYSKRSGEYRPTIGRIENAKTIGDYATFAFETLVENAPMLASMAIPGGLVAKGAQIAGASLKAASVAGTTAAFLSNVGLQTGESGSIAREAGESPADIRVVGHGIGKAALDFVPLLGLAKRFGLVKNLPLAAKLERFIVGKMSDGGFIRRAAGHAGAIVIREVPTEVAQEYMNISLQRLFAEHKGDLTEEEWSQMFNAAAGATAFGLLGIPAGIRKPGPDPGDKASGDTPEGVDIQVVTDPLQLEGPGPGTDLVVADIAVEGDFIPAGEEPPPGAPSLLPITEPKLPRLETASVDPDIDASQRTAAKRASLGEEELPPSDVFFVDSDGTVIVPKTLDPIHSVQSGDGPIISAVRRTAEMAEVAESYPQYADLDSSTPEAQNIAALHPGLQTLYELRDDFVGNADNYRTTDGLIKKSADTTLGNIDKRIEVLEERLGIPPRAANEALELTPKVAQDPDPVVELPPNPLTDSQAQRMEALSIKETEVGLTPAEYDTFVELQAIATGEIQAERKTQSQEELSELRDITKEVRAAETTRVDDTRPSTDRQRGTPYVSGIEGTGIGIEEASKWLRIWAARLKFGPKIKLHLYAQAEAQRQTKHFGRKTYGWWRSGEAGFINIIVDNHHSLKDLQRTYLHETLSHYGLRTMLTRDQMLDIFDSMIKNPPPGLNTARFRGLMESNDVLALQREAEEYIAGYAEDLILNPKSGLVEEAFWRRLLAWMRKALRFLDPSVKWTDTDIHHMLRNVSKGLSGQVTPRNRPNHVGAFSENVMSKIAGDDYGPKIAGGLDSLFRVYGARFNNIFMTPLQFQEKYNVPGAEGFLDTVQQWWARKRTLTNDATELVSTILKLDKRSQQKLSEAILKISIRSDELKRRLNEQELRAMFKEMGMAEDDHLIKLWKGVNDSFQDMVVQLRGGLEKIAIRVQEKGENLSREETDRLWRKLNESRIGTAKQRQEFMNEVGVGTWLRLQEIEQEMSELENRNYFPRMRFGNKVITIRAKKDLTFEGKKYEGPSGDKRGDVVFFQGYESDSALRSSWSLLKKEFGETSFEMQAGELNDQEFHFMGVMSPQLYENLKMAIPAPSNPAEAAMNDRMKTALREVYLRQSPGRSFLRHLVQRKGIAGYSEDVLRVYSSYMMNVSNHIARVEYHIDMNEHLAVIREQASTVVPDARIEGIVTNYFQEQYDYLMNPKDDLARVRSLGFLWYLGFNVKSAMVNLTQVPMVAYPYLASRYGDIKSSAAILRALKLVTAVKLGGKVLPKELRDAIDQGVREGFIDESRATELAALGENHVLQRMLPASEAGRLQAKTAYFGAWLFQHAERYNREVTFIAAYNLAKENGVRDPAEAFKLGRKAVQTAMFEYAKWARPVFMRGKKSVFFLFWQFMQGLSYLAFGGQGSGAALRVWMMLLLAGGLQGLPFAENILDILDFVGTKTKQLTGMKDPRVDLRNDLRAFARDLTDRPDLIMHGLSRYYGAGPAHLLNLFDIPLNVDTSGSLSAGRVIPGTEEFGTSDRDPNAQLGRFMVDAFGPVAGMGYNLWRAAMDENPDTWKKWERAMPSALKNASIAVRRAVKGEEKFRGGGVVAEFDPQDALGRAELIAQFLGFATTRVNQRFESDFSIQRMKQYWAIRRALVMENVAYARMSGDREAMADANKAMVRFNEGVPDSLLRVRGDQLLTSLKQRFRRATLRERGIPSELLYRRIVRTMRDLYPETEAEIESLSQR